MWGDRGGWGDYNGGNVCSASLHYAASLQDGWEMLPIIMVNQLLHLWLRLINVVVNVLILLRC